MGVMDLFWLLFMLSAVEPLIRRRMLEATRLRMLARIERERGSRVILLVHRQETMGFLGFPVVRYIDINDAQEVLRAIQMTDADVPLDLVLHTPGGLVLASLQIARAVRKRRGKVRVIVPHYAMSGGTLIALAADEIIMSENAVLGPVDPQLGEWPAASLVRVLREKPLSEIDDETLIRADVAEKALRQVQEAVQELLADRMPPERVHELARTLTQGTWTHDHPITFETARSLGLPVRIDIPEAFMHLMTLYPQPTRQQSSVEYWPYRRNSPGSRDSK
ncbi:MAG: ATP-dependent Clp protease proteolytic subunit [Phycisphaerales bacterium]|nr:ATP-dependent Clp protease proteolytic subunit [Phycisphaerales bacterium]